MVDSINSSNSAAVAANKAAKQASPQTAGAPNTVIPSEWVPAPKPFWSGSNKVCVL